MVSGARCRQCVKIGPFMSSWSSGLVKIINRVSAVLYLSALSVGQASSCQAVWDLVVFHKPQLRSYVGVSSLIWENK